jgi:esterase
MVRKARLSIGFDNGGETMETPEEIEQLRLVAEISGLKPPQVVLPESGDVVVRGFRLHYLDWGNPNAGTILFLHGGGLNAHTWDVVSLMLRGHYRCVALDQRGHGDSEWSPGSDYGMASHLRDIEGFVQHMRLRRPLLVGQSMGGINAINYASRHSDEIAGLVVIDVGPEIIPAGGERIRDFIAAPQLDSPDEFLKRATQFNPLRDPRILRRSLYYNLRQLPNAKWTWKHDTRRAAEYQSGDMAAAAANRAEELWKAVPKIRCPALVVRGVLSDVISDDQAEKFVRALPNGRLARVEKAGHNVQGDNPAGLLAVLQPFVREISL